MSMQQYDLKDFSRVEVESAMSVEISRSEGYLVSAEATEQGHIRVEKMGDTLHVGRRGLGWFVLPSRARVTIAMPVLERASFSGASQGKVAGFRSEGEMAIKLSGASHLEVRDTACGKLRLEVSGASNLVGEVSAQETEMSVSGASRVELSGSGGRGRFKLSGASQARLPALGLSDTDLESSGASSSQLKVVGKLDINLSGASRLEYSGNPTLGNVRVSGASTLNRRP